MLSHNSPHLHRFFFLLQYLLYRLIRAFVLVESDIFAYIQSFISSNRSSDQHPCEILRIVYRKRFHVGDVARFVDFIVFHERMASCEELWEHNWILYTVDEHFAYFVRMPNPSFTYNVNTTPYLNVCQYATAEFVARLPHAVFVQQSERLRTFPGEVIMLSTMARSGSTLLARMLQACDPNTRDVLVLSENDSFSAVALQMADFSISVEKARTLLLASLRFACKDQLAQQTLILKMRWNCTRIVPHMKVIASDVVHIYIGKRDLERAVISQILYAQDEDILQTLLVLRRIHPAFCDWVTTLARMEWPLVNMIQPQSVLELAIALVSESFTDFVRYHNCFSTPAVFYEELMEAPNEEMKRLLEACYISETCVRDCVNYMKYDDRSSTNDETIRANISLCDSDRQKLRHLCSLIGYPLLH